MFWADIALSHPDHIHRIPDDAIALAWGYEADTDFDHWADILGAAGKTAWVCPGTSSWRSITGRTSVRRANCQAAADAAAKHKLPGYLITDWGDAGHHQTWPIALLAIAEAADAAWNAGREPQVKSPPPQRGGGAERSEAGEVRPSLAAAISLHCFDDRTLTTASWLAELGDIDKDLRPRAGRAWFEGLAQPLHNASAHFADLAEPWHSDAIALTAEDFEPLLDRVTHLRASLPTADQGRGLSSPRDTSPTHLLRAELTHTLNHAELAMRRAIARRTSQGGARFHPASLLPLAQHIHDTHTALWPRRSRPGRGLTDSLSHHQRPITELQTL